MRVPPIAPELPLVVRLPCWLPATGLPPPTVTTGGGGWGVPPPPPPLLNGSPTTTPPPGPRAIAGSPELPLPVPSVDFFLPHPARAKGTTASSTMIARMVGPPGPPAARGNTTQDPGGR